MKRVARFVVRDGTEFPTRKKAAKYVEKKRRELLHHTANRAFRFLQESSNYKMITGTPLAEFLDNNGDVLATIQAWRDDLHLEDTIDCDCSD